MPCSQTCPGGHAFDAGSRAGRQTDFALDLLFFHRSLICLLATELKVTPFEPEHPGKLNFYLEALASGSFQAVTFDLSCCHRPGDDTARFSVLRAGAPAHMVIGGHSAGRGRFGPFNWHNLAFDPFNLSQPAEQRVACEIRACQPPSKENAVCD